MDKGLQQAQISHRRKAGNKIAEKIQPPKNFFAAGTGFLVIHQIADARGKAVQHFVVQIGDLGADGGIVGHAAHHRRAQQAGDHDIVHTAVQGVGKPVYDIGFHIVQHTQIFEILPGDLAVYNIGVVAAVAHGHGQIAGNGCQGGNAVIGKVIRPPCGNGKAGKNYKQVARKVNAGADIAALLGGV